MDRKIKSICVIADNFPSYNRPVNTFVDQLVCELADLGIHCNVIAPESITKHYLRGIEYAPYFSERKTKMGNIINVYRPRFISFSNYILKINTSYLTYLSYKSCVYKEIKKKNITYDALYGHFIYPSGMSVAEIGEMTGKPSFLAYGECSPAEYDCIKKTVLQTKLKKLSGIISVSSDNKRHLIVDELINESDNIEVFPNGIDGNKFYKMDKRLARKQLGIDSGKFIVAFVGYFIRRKGVTVLSEALNQLDDVFSIFIGSGPETPNCKNILYTGAVPHEKVQLYLNAADIFVLPTQAEGCCNAIIEAMACGLPIVSSDQPFNDDILNSKNSIRLNVNDSDAIKNAIVSLRDNPELRNRMSEAAIESASQLNIKNRAKRILEFMNSRI